ncbi:DUF6163 family protein [Bosea sp. Leaf344]|uniref:DUF6163 family protein n=1 Tax=Bosea sp. Leaf344 TaxID=1736346 RepID=UPI000AE9CADB|nr:DUF6163 family protein [Bosea sp. Leaf344]
MPMGGDGEPMERIEGTLSDVREKPTRWRLVLVWLLRLLSVIWMIKGLMAWSIIFGVGPEAAIPFENRLLSFQAVTVYFAVIDLVAAVGLWLTSTWGGVLWLLACISQLLLGFFFPRLLPLSLPLLVSYGGLILAYFVATWLAEVENA